MKKYCVSLMVVYSDTVEANSPEEAVNIVADDCPYNMDGTACVTDLETDEYFEI